MSEDNFWTALFLVFLLFVFMFLAFFHLRTISESVYEGITTRKNVSQNI